MFTGVKSSVVFKGSFDTLSSDFADSQTKRGLCTHSYSSTYPLFSYQLSVIFSLLLLLQKTKLTCWPSLFVLATVRIIAMRTPRIPRRSDPADQDPHNSRISHFHIHFTDFTDFTYVRTYSQTHFIHFICFDLKFSKHSIKV